MKLAASSLEGVAGATVRGDPATADPTASPTTRVTSADGTLFFCVPGLNADGHDVRGRAPSPPAPRRWCASATPELDVHAGRRALCAPRAWR